MAAKKKINFESLEELQTTSSILVADLQKELALLNKSLEELKNKPTIDKPKPQIQMKRIDLYRGNGDRDEFSINAIKLVFNKFWEDNNIDAENLMTDKKFYKKIKEDFMFLLGEKFVPFTIEETVMAHRIFVDLTQEKFKPFKNINFDVNPQQENA